MCILKNHRHKVSFEVNSLIAWVFNKKHLKLLMLIELWGNNTLSVVIE